MSLRRRIEGNYRMEEVTECEDPEIIRLDCVEKDCEIILASIWLEKLEENFYLITCWKNTYYDEWVLRLIIKCLKFKGWIIKVPREPLGFWESEGFEIKDEEGFLFYNNEE